LTSARTAAAVRQSRAAAASSVFLSIFTSSFERRRYDSRVMSVVGRAVAIVLLLSSAAAAPATSPASGPGEFDLSFEQRSPLSSIDVQHARYGVERAKPNIYQLAEEKFVVRVPAEYDGSAGWGLLIWSSPGRRGGGVPDDWQSLLAKKKLIWASAYDAGNDRGVGARVGLALDAVHNLRQQYKLDERRTYVAGVSGGAKVAEMAAMAFPEVFDGAICCAGANWYKDTPVPGQPGKAWQQSFRKPPPPQFVAARDHVGFILITGTEDGNYAPMKAMYDGGFLVDKFKHVSFYDVPGLGHRTPSVEWIEKAIDELDALPKTRVKKLPATKPANRRPASP
jgi:pimeloyl-ACP methyl ester carboxylesterase